MPRFLHLTWAALLTSTCFINSAMSQEEPLPNGPSSYAPSIQVMDLLPTEPDAELEAEGSTETPVEIPPMVDPNAPIDDSELPPEISYNGVVLNGINKITGRGEEISGAVGTVIRFNNLEVIAHECQSITDQGTHGFAALLEIWEMKVGDSPKKILQGWMFSTSPSLYSLEHPLYDISVKECKTVDTEAEANEASDAAKKKARDEKATKDAKKPADSKKEPENKSEKKPVVKKLDINDQDPELQKIDKTKR